MGHATIEWRREWHHRTLGLPDVASSARQVISREVHVVRPSYVAVWRVTHTRVAAESKRPIYSCGGSPRHSGDRILWLIEATVTADLVERDDTGHAALRGRVHRVALTMGRWGARGDVCGLG